MFDFLNDVAKILKKCVTGKPTPTEKTPAASGQQTASSLSEDGKAAS